MGQQPSNEISEKQVKALELLTLYKQLEEVLSKPSFRVGSVGEAYRQILNWCKDNGRDDATITSILEILSHEERFPAWRRQALEEAYRIFYDEAAQAGLSDLNELPEPPTSEEIGFRALSETLVDGQAVQQQIYEGSFADSSLFFRRSRCDYEIHKQEQAGAVSGRRIVAKVQSRYWEAAGDVASRAMKALLPVDECCSAREDARVAKGPFLLPKGARGQRSLPGDASYQEARPKPVPKMEPLHFEDHDVVKQRARLSFPQPRG